MIKVPRLHREHARHRKTRRQPQGGPNPVQAPGNRSGERRNLRLASMVTGTILLVETAGGIWSGSLALLADAGHMLADLAALLVALLASRVACRPADRRRTWGYHRVEILSALLNGLLLVGISSMIIWRATIHLRDSDPIHVTGMMAVAGVGLLANVTGILLVSAEAGSINVKGALWHLMGDTLSSAGVLLAGVLIYLTGEVRIDPLISIGIAGIIVLGAIRLIREAYNVLLEAVPAGIDSQTVALAISGVAGVNDIHDLHVWSITTGMPALSGHVVVPAADKCEHDAVLTRVKLLLRERFGIEHSTIQVESTDFKEIGELH